MKLLLLFFFQLFFFFGHAHKVPKPTPQQLAWHKMEYYWFIHFGPNTFTGKEWGHGDEKEEIFNPEKIDCRQWARIAKASGAKGIIITAKHHDGFCLWPSKYSTHTVAQSKWRNGKGDVLKELSQACREYGLKFGVYISPWDRNHPKYGTDEYNDVFVNMMNELFTNYGPIWELWWDGANGEGPNGKQQVYDWNRYEKFVRKISPKTIVFSDIGPDCRWVGNEQGIAGKTNWNYLNTDGFSRGKGAPMQDTLSAGNRFGKYWIPAECDVSIRPGWFYHAEEDDKVKTGNQLFDLYLKSVGRGATLLLNIPPNTSGLIAPQDSAALISFYKTKSQAFAKPLFRALFKEPASSRNIVLKQPAQVNTIVLVEDIASGQFIESFSIALKRNGAVVKTIKGTTVGNKRILTFPAIEIDGATISLNNGRTKTRLLESSFYLIPQHLIEQP